MKPIGKDSDTIKWLKKHLRRGYTPGALVCEELGVLEKYLDAPSKMPLKTLIICEAQVKTDYAKGLYEGLSGLAGDVFAVSDKIYAQIADKKNGGGLMGVFDYAPKTADDFAKQAIKKVVVLDGLENPGNVGTILRSVDATGFDAVVTVNLKTHVNGSKCVSASRGMVFNVPVYQMTLDEAQSALQKHTCYLGEPKAGEAYNKIVYDETCAIVLGAERFGVDESWYRAPHKAVYVPMQGSMTSLNVGVAATLLMYEIANQK